MTILEQYKDYLKARNLSFVYFNYTKLWLDYCEQNKINYLELTQQNITDFFNANTYSTNSKNNFIKSGRNFYLYLGIEKEKNEWFKIKLMEVENRLRQYISYDDLLRGIKYYATYNIKGMPTNKCSALLKFWFFTSLRKGELLSLKREKIDLINCSVSIWGQKDKTERIVYFPDSFLKELTEYFNSEEEKENAFSVTAGEINYLAKKIGKYLDKNISPHTFRHSGEKYMVSKNVSPLIMQRIMGHNSLQTTLIYAQIDDKQAQEVYKKQIG